MSESTQAYPGWCLRLCDAETERPTLQVFDYGPDDDSIAFYEVMSRLSAFEAAELLVVIHSRGAFPVVEALSLCSLLKSLKAKVTVEVIGVAGGSASLVAMAGSVIRMAPQSHFFLRAPGIATNGNARVLLQQARTLERLTAQILDAYEVRVPRNTIRDYMESGDGAGTWISAADAVGIGLADELMPAIEPQSSEPEREFVFRSCQACSSKAPGDNLCLGCAHNRAVIQQLSKWLVATEELPTNVDNGGESKS